MELYFDFDFNFSKSELKALLSFNGAIASFFFFNYMKIEILLMMQKGKYIMDKSLLKEARVLYIHEKIQHGINPCRWHAYLQ